MSKCESILALWVQCIKGLAHQIGNGRMSRTCTNRALLLCQELHQLRRVETEKAMSLKYGFRFLGNGCSLLICQSIQRIDSIKKPFENQPSLIISNLFGTS